MSDYRKMFEQAILNQQAQPNDPVRQKLEARLMQDNQEPSLAPTMALIDSLTGSNLSQAVPKKENVEDKLGKLLEMRNGEQSQKLNGLGQLAKMQDQRESSAAERAFKEKMFGLQLLNAKAKMAKANGSGAGGGMRKLGSEDVKAVSNIDMILDNLPKLKAAMAQGQSLKPSVMGYTIGGDNDATTARRMVIEAIGRLQSGGAIGNEEVKNFSELISSVQDDPATREAKIGNLLSEFGRRRNNYIYGPSATYQSGDSINTGNAAPQRKPSTGGTKGALAGLDLDNMSDQEIQALFQMQAGG